MNKIPKNKQNKHSPLPLIGGVAGVATVIGLAADYVVNNVSPTPSQTASSEYSHQQKEEQELPIIDGRESFVMDTESEAGNTEVQSTPEPYLDNNNTSVNTNYEHMEMGNSTSKNTNNKNNFEQLEDKSENRFIRDDISESQLSYTKESVNSESYKEEVNNDNESVKSEAQSKFYQNVEKEESLNNEQMQDEELFNTTSTASNNIDKDLFSNSESSDNEINKDKKIINYSTKEDNGSLKNSTIQDEASMSNSTNKLNNEKMYAETSESYQKHSNDLHSKLDHIKETSTNLDVIENNAEVLLNEENEVEISLEFPNQNFNEKNFGEVGIETSQLYINKKTNLKSDAADIKETELMHEDAVSTNDEISTHYFTNADRVSLNSNPENYETKSIKPKSSLSQYNNHSETEAINNEKIISPSIINSQDDLFNRNKRESLQSEVLPTKLICQNEENKPALEFQEEHQSADDENEETINNDFVKKNLSLPIKHKQNEVDEEDTDTENSIIPNLETENESVKLKNAEKKKEESIILPVPIEITPLSTLDSEEENKNELFESEDVNGNVKSDYLEDLISKNNYKNKDHKDNFFDKDTTNVTKSNNFRDFEKNGHDHNEDNVKPTDENSKSKDLAEKKEDQEFVFSLATKNEKLDILLNNKHNEFENLEEFPKANFLEFPNENLEKPSKPVDENLDPITKAVPLLIEELKEHEYEELIDSETPENEDLKNLQRESIEKENKNDLNDSLKYFENLELSESSSEKFNINNKNKDNSDNKHQENYFINIKDIPLESSLIKEPSDVQSENNVKNFDNNLSHNYDHNNDNKVNDNDVEEFLVKKEFKPLGPIHKDDDVNYDIKSINSEKSFKANNNRDENSTKISNTYSATPNDKKGNLLIVQPSIEITPASDYEGSIEEQLNKDFTKIEEEEKDKELKNKDAINEKEKKDIKLQLENFRTEKEENNDSYKNTYENVMLKLHYSPDFNNQHESITEIKHYTNGFIINGENGYDNNYYNGSSNINHYNNKDNNSEEEDEEKFNEKSSLISSSSVNKYGKKQLHIYSSDEENNDDEDDDNDSVIINTDVPSHLGMATQRMQAVSLTHPDNDEAELGKAYGSNL